MIIGRGWRGCWVVDGVAEQCLGLSVYTESNKRAQGTSGRAEGAAGRVRSERADNGQAAEWALCVVSVISGRAPALRPSSCTVPSLQSTLFKCKWASFRNINAPHTPVERPRAPYSLPLVLPILTHTLVFSGYCFCCSLCSVRVLWMFLSLSTKDWCWGIGRAMCRLVQVVRSTNILPLWFNGLVCLYLG